jgi:tetratricopeptide (TPR) repeat protein
MDLKPAICPFCGGDLRLPEDKKTLKCMYCGKDIIVSEAIEKAVGPTIENMLTLARCASNSGNNKEAYDYFTKVLELSPSHYEAWFGKGASAGWLSTLADFRFPEMITGFENALKYCPQDKTEEMKLKSADMINKVAVALYKLNCDLMFEYGRSGNEAENFYTRCRGIVNALELANSYSPADKQIIENIIDVCKSQIEGVQYKDFNEYGQIRKKSRVNPQYAQTLRLKMDEYVSKRGALDPLCPICRVPLTWIPQYKRWYCYTDQKYA